MNPTELERPATVLVVDDEPDMRMLACAVLKAAGLQIAGQAVDGHDALAKLRAMQPPHLPTVVLLDNQMPGPRGLEVAAQIRAGAPRDMTAEIARLLVTGGIALWQLQQGHASL